MTLSSVKSDFEIPLGLKITGVDNSTFSLTGEAYSHIVAPKTESTAARVLQKDDVALGMFQRQPLFESSELGLGHPPVRRCSQQPCVFYSCVQPTSSAASS